MYAISIQFNNKFTIDVNMATNKEVAQRTVDNIFYNYIQEINGAHDGFYNDSLNVPGDYDTDLTDWQKDCQYGPCINNIKIDQKYLDEIKLTKVPIITAIESRPLN